MGYDVASTVGVEESRVSGVYGFSELLEPLEPYRGSIVLIS